MIEKKTIEVVVCDVCGTDDRDAQIKNVNYLRGLGYEPSNDDPLARKFKKLYVKKDVCDRCQARMNHNFLSLSSEEHEQIVYSCLAVYDNRKDLRSDLRLQKFGHSKVGRPNLFSTMDAVQEEPIEEKEFKYDGEHSVSRWPSYNE